MTVYDFEAISGWKHLADDVKQFGEDHEYTTLTPPLTDGDPDDAFSSVRWSSRSDEDRGFFRTDSMC